MPVVRERRGQWALHASWNSRKNEGVKKNLKEKDRSIDHYGNHIYVCELSGRPNLLCFKDMAAWVLEDFKKKSHQNANNCCCKNN